jgi:hypothetical protein
MHPGASSPQAIDVMSQTNGKSGIWMSGFGLAVDAPNNRVFFAVGYVFLQSLEAALTFYLATDKDRDNY